MVQKPPSATPTPQSGGIDLSAGLVSHADAGTQAPYPIAEADKGAISNMAKVGESILKLPANIWHAFSGEPQDETEKASVAALSKIPQFQNPNVALGIHRLILAPMMKSAEVADAYQKIADQKKALHAASAAGKPKDDSLVKELTLGLIDPEGKPAPGREWDSSKSLPRNLWNFIFSGNADDNGEREQHMANVHRIASIAPLAGASASDITEHYAQGDPSGAVAQLLTLIAAGKATDSLTKGVGKQIKKVAPTKAVVAGETAPVMAGQMKDAAPIAKEVATEPSTQIAEDQQTAAQQGVKNVATEAANRAIDKTAATAEPKYAYRVRDVGEEGVPVRNGHAQASMSEEEAQGYVEGRQNMRGGVPQEVVKIDLNKLDPADYSIKEGPSGNPWVKFNKDLPESAIGETAPAPKPEPVKADSFGDAAAKVKDAAQVTFKKLDKLSDGEFATLQNKMASATKIMRKATSIEDLEAAEKQYNDAQQGIDALFKKHAGEIGPEELSGAQAAWKDMNVLKKVHSYVESAFSAPEDVAGSSNMVTRQLNGSKLKPQLNQMLNKVPRADLERVLGPDGVKNLYEIAELTAKPENLAKMQQQINQVASSGYVTKLVKSPLEARNLVARYLATSPRVSGLMMSALKFGTPAKVYGPLVANAIAKAQEDENSK